MCALNVVKGMELSMSNMFDGCNSLTNLDLGSFDTSQVTNMSFMFGECPSLTNLDLRNATFTAVTDSREMFRSSPSSIQIIVKDTTAQSWIQERLGSGRGNVIIAS